MNNLQNNQKSDAAPMGYDTLLCTVDFDKRITEKPFYQSWHNGQFQDSIREDGKIDYNGLDDINKLSLYIYAWNKSDILPSKRGILKKFGWTNYKLQKLIKQVGKIRTEPTFDENTGLLSGRGYFFYGE